MNKTDELHVIKINGGQTFYEKHANGTLNKQAPKATTNFKTTRSTKLTAGHDPVSRSVGRPRMPGVQKIDGLKNERSSGEKEAPRGSTSGTNEDRRRGSSGRTRARVGPRWLRRTVSTSCPSSNPCCDRRTEEASCQGGNRS